MCKACWEKCLELNDFTLDEINELPNQAFAVLEPAYESGKTTDRRARHLPHHNQGVKTRWDSKDNLNVDYLKAMLEAAETIEPVTDSISKEDLVSRATRHLQRHAEDINLVSDKKPADKQDDDEPEPGKKTSSLSASLSSDIIDLLASKDICLNKDGSCTATLRGGFRSLQDDMINYDAINSKLQSLEGGSIQTLRDIKPKPEDYVYIDFRALSKVITPNRFLNFTIGNVLKKSTKLIDRKTIFPNHIHAIEEWLGVVQKPKWDSISDPQGINILLKIYAYANPKITLGLMVDPPAINSGSVNVNFDWEKSHKLDDYEFFSMLGREVDDKIVTIDCTNIRGYGEFSLVWLGEDPFAKNKSEVKIGNE